VSECLLDTKFESPSRSLIFQTFVDCNPHKYVSTLYSWTNSLIASLPVCKDKRSVIFVDTPHCFWHCGVFSMRISPPFVGVSYV